MYNNLIHSTEMVDAFFRSLSSLEEHECYMVSMFSRKKYATEEQKSNLNFNINDQSIDRRIVKSNSVKLSTVLCKYCTRSDAWTDKNDNVLPENVLAIYMTVNPRDARKAYKNWFAKSFDDVMDDKYDFVNTESRYKSELQKSVSRKVLVDIDIDVKDEDVLRDVLNMLDGGKYVHSIVQTRGGYHVLADVAKMSYGMLMWHKKLSALTDIYSGDVEFKTDTLCPVPGTIQGGHDVFLLDVEDVF